MARIRWDVEHLAAWAAGVDWGEVARWAIAAALLLVAFGLAGASDYADRVASLSGRW
ncbi:MAG: hypothetical protein ACI38Z_04635 [Parafannyhessea sp.]|uniref:hypothetical protein n=1 Tax=Parafannyhessea sp. TaxID=2847324 RepID=UPI003F10B332